MSSGCAPEYNAETKRLMDHLEKLKAQAREVTRNQTRQNQLEKQSASMREKVAAGDTSRPPKRDPLQYDEGVQKAQIERDQLRRQIDALVAKGDRLNQSTAKRVMDFATGLHMFNIFTSMMVYPKLMAAVVGGHALAIAQAGTISLAKMIPAIRRIADISERHGAGLTLGGLKARAKGLAAAPAGALETLKHGHSKLEAAHGDPVHATDAYWGYVGTLKEALDSPGLKNKIFEAAQVISSVPGRTHGVIKQFLSTPEFFQSYFDRSLQIKKHMEAQGHTPEEIEHFLSKETTQATIGGKALMDAYESKMQGKNAISDSIIGAINRMNSSKDLGPQLFGFALKNIMPVARVGSNVFKQGTSLMFGGAKATGAALMDKIYKREMTPERADYIMKNIGQQGAGLAAMVAVGMVFSDYLGGIPGAVKTPKKTNTEGDTIKPDEADIAGIPVGAWGFHGAPFAMIQMGASIKKVFESEVGKQGATDAALTAFGSNLWNWSERTVPEADVVRRTAQTLEYGRKHGKYGNPWGEVLGNQLRSMTVPLILQQKAAADDPFKGFRTPHNIKQDMMLGIPGEREQVPQR